MEVSVHLLVEVSRMVDQHSPCFVNACLLRGHGVGGRSVRAPHGALDSVPRSRENGGGRVPQEGGGIDQRVKVRKLGCFSE